MAHLAESADGLRVRLSRWERLGALHGEFTIPRERIVSTELVADPWTMLRGWRAPGTGIPFVIMLGTMRRHGLKDFCAIYRRRPATIVTCEGFEFARVIITLTDTTLTDK